LITLLVGVDPPPGLVETVTAHIDIAHPGVEVVVYIGGQRGDALQLGVGVMATLADRLDRLLGAKAATPLAEEFGLHTVEDLLRHYPHRYATQGRRSPRPCRRTARTSPSSPDCQGGEGSHAQSQGNDAEGGVGHRRSTGGHHLLHAHKVAHVVQVGRRAMMSGTSNTGATQAARNGISVTPAI